jgi:S1-C subfamily serine protease
MAMAIAGEERARWPALFGVIAVAIAGAAGYVWWSLGAVSVERIASEASESVYLLALQEGDRRTIVGTAFVIDGTGVLATNAHVAERLRGSSALAIRGDTYDSSEIQRVILHPRWTAGSFANDVALVELERPTSAPPLRLADAPELERLHRGAQLAAFGFPAASTDPFKPRGRVSTDVLADFQPPYLGVNLSIAPGMSGSPVFSVRGAVVGIVLAGDFVRATPGAPQRPSGSAANWAISVGVLRDLLPATR